MNKLTPEEQALVDSAKPRSQAVSTLATHQVKEAKNVTKRINLKKEPVANAKVHVEESNGKRGRPRRKTQEERSATSGKLHEEILITDSFKLKKFIQQRLLRASFERKLSKKLPYTKQAIVNEAIDAWLSTNGF